MDERFKGEDGVRVLPIAKGGQIVQCRYTSCRIPSRKSQFYLQKKRRAAPGVRAAKSSEFRGE